MRAQGQALDNRLKAWKMVVSAGLSNTEAAEKLGVSTRTVARYLRRTLETESRYPADLSPEKIAELRQIQAEVLSSSRRMAVETQAIVKARVGTSAEKSGDAMAVGKLLEAVVRAVDMEAALFGTRQPLKVIEESHAHGSSKMGNTTIVFDESMLKDDGRPVPGLHIGVAPALLGALTRALQQQNGEDG